MARKILVFVILVKLVQIAMQYMYFELCTHEDQKWQTLEIALVLQISAEWYQFQYEHNNIMCNAHSCTKFIRRTNQFINSKYLVK